MEWTKLENNNKKQSTERLWTELWCCEWWADRIRERTVCVSAHQAFSNSRARLGISSWQCCLVLGTRCWWEVIFSLPVGKMGMKHSSCSQWDETVESGGGFFFFFRHVRMPQANWPYCDERVSVKCVTWLCERWLLCSSLSGPPCFGSFLLWGGKMRRREALKVSAETNRTDQGALQLTWIHLGLWRVWAQVMSHLWCLCCSCTGVVHLCAQVTMQRSSKMNTKDTQICNSTRILDISLIIKSESMHLVSIWICV